MGVTRLAAQFTRIVRLEDPAGETEILLAIQVQSGPLGIESPIDPLFLYCLFGWGGTYCRIWVAACVVN